MTFYGESKSEFNFFVRFTSNFDIGKPTSSMGLHWTQLSSHVCTQLHAPWNVATVEYDFLYTTVDRGTRIFKSLLLYTTSHWTVNNQSAAWQLLRCKIKKHFENSLKRLMLLMTKAVGVCLVQWFILSTTRLWNCESLGICWKNRSQRKH